MKISEYKKIVKKFILDADTSYALMLDGEWGSGKTHFWENTICKEILEETKKVSSKHTYIPIYISLNGKANIEEIKTEILQTQIAQRTGVSLNTIKIGHLLGSGILKFAKQTLDINKIAEQFDWDLSEGGLQKNIFKNIKSPFNKKDEDLLIKASQDSFRFLICFDDLERSRVNIQEVWGVMSDFVEQQKNTKVIILANTKELEEETKKQFNKIKEKVVGQHVPFTPIGKDVLKGFLQTMVDRYNKDQTDYQSDYSSATFILENFQEELINAIDEENINFRSVKSATKNLFTLLDLLRISNRNIKTSEQLKPNKSNGFPKSKSVIRIIIKQTVRISLLHTKMPFNLKSVTAFIKEKKEKPFKKTDDFFYDIFTNKKSSPNEYIGDRLRKAKIDYNDVNEEILNYIVNYNCNTLALLVKLKPLEKKDLTQHTEKAYEDHKRFFNFIYGREHSDVVENLKSVLEHVRQGRYPYTNTHNIIWSFYKNYLNNGYSEVTDKELKDAYKQGLRQNSVYIDKKVNFELYFSEVIHGDYVETLNEYRDIFDSWKKEHNSNLELEQGKQIYQNVYNDNEINFDLLYDYYHRGFTGFFFYLSSNDLRTNFLAVSLNTNENIDKLRKLINSLRIKDVKVENPDKYTPTTKIQEGLSKEERNSLKHLHKLVSKYSEEGKFDTTKKIHLQSLCTSLEKLNESYK